MCVGRSDIASQKLRCCRTWWKRTHISKNQQSVKCSMRFGQCITPVNFSGLHRIWWQIYTFSSIIFRKLTNQTWTHFYRQPYLTEKHLLSIFTKFQYNQSKLREKRNSSFRLFHEFSRSVTNFVDNWQLEILSWSFHFITLSSFILPMAILYSQFTKTVKTRDIRNIIFLTQTESITNILHFPSI